MLARVHLTGGVRLEEPAGSFGDADMAGTLMEGLR